MSSCVRHTLTDLWYESSRDGQRSLNNCDWAAVSSYNILYIYVLKCWCSCLMCGFARNISFIDRKTVCCCGCFRYQFQHICRKISFLLSRYRLVEFANNHRLATDQSVMFPHDQNSQRWVNDELVCSTRHRISYHTQVTEHTLGYFVLRPPRVHLRRERLSRFWLNLATDSLSYSMTMTYCCDSLVLMFYSLTYSSLFADDAEQYTKRDYMNIDLNRIYVFFFDQRKISL